MSKKFEIKGRIHYILKDEFGNIKFENIDTNTITNGMDAHVADQMSDQGDAQIGFLALGSGTGQGAADTDVSNYITTSILALSGAGAIQGTGGNDNDVIYYGYWGAGVGTGSITEIGMFLGSATVRADMMSYNDSLNIQKAAGDTLKVDWTITWGAS